MWDVFISHAWEDKEDIARPQHHVYVSEFHIGKYPVTNAQYAVFVRATRHRVPRHWREGEIPSGKESHPVVNVS
jgi:formylglycine-generating enzyme required for sulfatase activity